MQVTAAQGMARILKAEGVSWVSTFPVCNINNTLAQEGVQLLMMREERYAVGVADALSRVSGGQKIGVCTVMGGMGPAGLQMAYGALAQAFEDLSPVLLITDGVPIGSGGIPYYDMTLGLSAITKWVGHIDQPQRVPEFMRRAFTYLRSGRRGPVVLTIPRNLGVYDDEQYPYVPVKGWKTAPERGDVKAAVKALLAAKNPLIFVGEGVFYGQATDGLRQFAELAQAPVLTTLKGKSAFPENHPLSVGVRGEMATTYLRDCDLLFAVGASITPSPFSHAVPGAQSKVIVQCADSEFDINRNYRTDIAVLGDAGLTLQALIEELLAQVGVVKENTARQAAIAVAKEHFLAKYRPLMESDEKPLNPYRVYGDLMKAIDLNNSLVTHDSGNTRDQLSTVYESLIPRGFVGWGNVTTLGFGLAAAIGGKLAYPERQCVNVTGDAGVSYMLGNLEALVRYNIGVTTIHINNGCFAGYGPGFWGQGHDPYTYQVSDHTIADMSEAVKALGYYAEHVTEPAEIVPALKRALAENAQNRPAYLEFICCPYPVYGEWATAGAAGH